MSENQTRHEEFCLRYIEKNVNEKSERVGIRCGLGDAAHLCDAIISDIIATRRPSKQRTEVLEALSKCGDAIWALRERVSVEPALAPTEAAGGSE